MAIRNVKTGHPQRKAGDVRNGVKKTRVNTTRESQVVSVGIGMVLYQTTRYTMDTAVRAVSIITDMILISITYLIIWSRPHSLYTLIKHNNIGM